MNVAHARVVLRPRGTGEILDLSCLIVGQHALGLYAWLTALVVIPGFGALLALRYVLLIDWWIVWLCAFSLSSLSQGVFTIAAGRWLFAEKLTVREVLAAFASRSLGFTVAWCTRLFMMALSSIGIVLPAAVGSLYLFVPEASLLEMASPLDAIRRSRHFTRHSFGRALGMWAALLVVTLIVTALVHLLCDGLVSDVLQLGHPFESIGDGGSPYLLLGLLLSAPYVATARFLMYVDGRTRTDGWDIQVRFMAIAQAREQAMGRSTGSSRRHGSAA